MATVKTISVFPTPDLHLVLSPDPIPVDVRAFIPDENDSNVDITDDSDTHWVENYPTLDFNSSIVEITRTDGIARFQPLSAGLTFGVVRHTTSEGTSEGVVRVFVHESIEEFWIANELVTVYEGRSDYVLTLLAVFSDGNIGDVTHWPGFTYSSDNESVATISNGEVTGVAAGRVTGVAAGYTSVTVSFGEMAVSKEVHVLEVPEYRELLVRVRGSGRHDDPGRRNILFLPEGFTTGESAIFFRLVDEITNALFSRWSNGPYNFFRDNFIVWSAWDDPYQAYGLHGISVGSQLAFSDYVSIEDDSKKREFSGVPIPLYNFAPPPRGVDDEDPPLDSEGHPLPLWTVGELTDVVGLPVASDTNYASTLTKWSTFFGFQLELVSEELFDQWLMQLDAGYLLVRNSRHGYIMGPRPCDPRTKPPNIIQTGSGPKPNPNSFYRPVIKQRSLGVDPRRGIEDFSTPTGANTWDSISRYIGSLRPASWADPSACTEETEPCTNVGETWKVGGKDYGLVCILVKQEYKAGTNTGPLLGVATGKHTFFTISEAAGPFATLEYVADTETEAPLSILASTVAHEFGHSFHLGDEYEAEEGYADTPPSAAITQQKGDSKDNLQSVDRLTTASSLDVTLIKWNWNRVIASARAMEDVSAAMPFGVITARVRRGGHRIWRNGDGGWLTKDVYLRNPNLNPQRVEDPPNPRNTPLLSGALRINDYVAATGSAQFDTILLEPGPNMTELEQVALYDQLSAGCYPVGSAVFSPLTDENGALDKLISPSVLAFLAEMGHPFEDKEHPFSSEDYAGHQGGCAVATKSDGFPREMYATYNLKRPARLIALYQGGGTFNCGIMRPTGRCYMRDQDTTPRFCHVCMYIIVNNIDPEQLYRLEWSYPYPML